MSQNNEYLESSLDTHIFLMAATATPTSTAATLTGELTFIRSITGGNLESDVQSEAFVDKGAFEYKAVTKRRTTDVQIEFARPGGSIYSTSGTDTYSVLTNWLSNAPLTNKLLVEVTPRDNNGTYEVCYYNALIQNVEKNGRDTDSVQGFTATFPVNGKRVDEGVYVTKSQDGTFSWSTTAPQS